MNDNLCVLLNYKFKNENLLNEALTRQSAITENVVGAASRNYQRLEFLGDSVLHLVISDFIFNVLPEKNECDLTNVRINLEKNEFIGKIARNIGIGNFIKIGKGDEMQKLRENMRSLADFFEAIVGAIYVDSNDFDTTKRIVMNLYKNNLFEYKIMAENKINIDLLFEKMNKNISKLKNLDIIFPNQNNISQEINNFYNEFKGLMNNCSVINLIDFVSKVKTNVFIEFDIYSVFNGSFNLDFQDNLIKNIICNLRIVIKQYFYDNDLKPHYICSKILLNLLIYYKNSDEFIYLTTIFCFTHNGISEFYRKNIKKAIEYFDFAFSILKDKQIDYPEIKILVTYYHCQSKNLDFSDGYLNFLQNDVSVQNYLKSIENVDVIFGAILINIMKFKINLKILLSSNNLAEIRQSFENLLNLTKNYFLRSKKILEVFVEIYFSKIEFETKYLNIKANIGEISKFDEEISKNFQNTAALEKFYRYYITNSDENDFVIHINRKLLNLLFEHFTYSSQIVINEICKFTDLISNLEK